MEAGAWEATVHGVAKSPTRLSDFTFTFFHFPGGTVVKHPPANGSDLGEACLIPGSGRSPGGGNSNPLQYFCLENPTDRGAWRATIHGVRKSWHD